MVGASRSRGLTEAERAFLGRRRLLLRFWPWEGLGRAVLLLGLLLGLYLKAPLLVHPGRVWSGLRNETLEASTVTLLAGMLPVVTLGWGATIAVVILFVSAALANERRHIDVIERVMQSCHSGSESGNMTRAPANGSCSMKIASLDHMVLTVRDVDTTVRFYCEVMGMKKEVFGEGRIALRFGTQKINLHQAGREPAPHAGNPVPGSADVCFLTDTPLEKAMDHVRAKGVDLVAGPVERTGARGPIRSFYLRDPDGNLIEVAQYFPDES